MFLIKVNSNRQSSTWSLGANSILLFSLHIDRKYFPASYVVRYGHMTGSVNTTRNKMKYATFASYLFTFSLPLTARCTKCGGRVRSSRRAEAMQGTGPRMTAENRILPCGRPWPGRHTSRKYIVIVLRHWLGEVFIIKASLPTEISIIEWGAPITPNTCGTSLLFGNQTV